VNITRRTMLRNLSAAGVGMGLAGLGWSRSAVAANERINVALIGARNMGGKTHLKALVGASECQLVAVCDVDKNVLAAAIGSAEKRYGGKTKSGTFSGVKGYGDFREVMEQKDIDAVVIATPDHWHVPIARAAVLSGKDVYVEKPLSLYVTEGRALLELATERKAMVQVGTQHRSDMRFFTAQAIVKAGMLGDIQGVEIKIPTRSGSGEKWQPETVPPELNYDMWVGPAPFTPYHSKRVHYNFRFVSAFSGGEITNWGAHYLDSAAQALGKDHTGPVHVEGKGQRHPRGSLHDSFFNIDVHYRYADGLKMNLKTGKADITIKGSKGTLSFSRGGFKLTPEALKKSIPKEEARALLKTKGTHLGNWFACVKSRRAEDLHAPLSIGHNSAIMCHQANIAMGLERPLSWDPEKEQFKGDAEANAMLTRTPREKWKV